MKRLMCQFLGCMAASMALVWPLAGQRALTPVRDLTIGAAEHDLSPIRDVMVSPHGVMAVTQPQDYVIRFFDSTGKALESFGRKGEGPGEFRSMWLRYGWQVDTLWLFENGGRLTWIGPDRKLLRTSRTPTSLMPPVGASGGGMSFGLSPVYALYPDRSMGMLLTVGSKEIRPPWLPVPAAASSVSFLARVGVDSQFKQLVAIPYVNPSGACEHMFGNGSAIGIPFCSRPADASASDGSVVITARPGKVSGTSGVYQVVAIDGRRGDTIFSKQYPYRLIAIPKGVADSVRKAEVSQPRLTPEMKDAYSSMEMPPGYPPFIRIVIGRDRTIWIEESPVTASIRRWKILDAKGNVIASLELPRNIRISEAELGRIWATETDEDGLQNVVRYRLR